MQSKGSSHRLSTMASRSRMSTLLISMFAIFASIYVAGRLWQDAESRVYLIKELDRITGQGQSAISVDDTLKIISCREQHKKLTSLEMELAAARQEGFVSKPFHETNGTYSRRRPLVVIGILTRFGRQNNRDAIRKAWMGNGAALKKMEDSKGIIARFVIGRSAKRGDSLDRDIDRENRQTNDFMILDNHVEANEELPKKAKLFFAHAADKWEAEFYAKVNDDVYVNIDALGATLATHLDKPRVYMGCMKSGEVFSEPNHKWYEPEWWKFGDKKSYFRHASGEMYVISRALAKFIAINRSDPLLFATSVVSVSTFYVTRLNLFTEFSDQFYVPMPMMMLVLDLGLLGSMSSMLMKGSFVAHLGHQEQFVRVSELVGYTVGVIHWVVYSHVMRSSDAPQILSPCDKLVSITN